MSINHKANKDEVAYQFYLTQKAEQERLQAIYDKIKQDEKFNTYTQRMVGEILALLIRKKLLTQGEAFMLTNYVKAQIFTNEELILLDKISKKTFKPQKK